MKNIGGMVEMVVMVLVLMVVQVPLVLQEVVQELIWETDQDLE